MKHKYLIAIDGSDASVAAARYAAAVLPSDRCEIVLFLVEYDMPESFWDIDPEPQIHPQQESMNEWRHRQNRFFTSSMEKIRSLFIEAGFPLEKVQIKIQRRKTGVTRDIVSESMDGYNGLIAGRTGFSSLSRLPLGSVARKLVSRIHSIPLVLVGENPETRHILIGFDDSHGSRRSIRMASSLFAGTDKQIHLRHVARSINPISGNFYPYPASMDPAELLFTDQSRIHKNKMNPALDKAVQILKERGVHAKNIDTAIIEGYMSRSLGLLDTAEKEKWGTIFVGRRGISRVQDFFIGRVGEKLIEMAKQQAVWIIG
ncbi:universal stress protein [Desulfobotulus sp. H1]|uniref:Universal stress protein n=1 Tax=Desulfobotulus pelophilus TaxID=2823377 RepID=A0ABT3NC08_9BACT|nr:universal stress protein [Desulfobotulus pelophilus]MCW7755005.1 universal stress protein [Desulfobotulus pelophilus]